MSVDESILDESVFYRLWVAHVIRQHSTQCRNTPNMAAEQCRSRARVARISTRTTTTNAETSVLHGCDNFFFFFFLLFFARRCPRGRGVSRAAAEAQTTQSVFV